MENAIAWGLKKPWIKAADRRLIVEWRENVGDTPTAQNRRSQTAATAIPGLNASRIPVKFRDCGMRGGLRRCATPVPDLPSLAGLSDARIVQLEFLRPTDNRAQSLCGNQLGRGPVLREFSRAD